MATDTAPAVNYDALAARVRSGKAKIAKSVDYDSLAKEVREGKRTEQMSAPEAPAAPSPSAPIVSNAPRGATLEGPGATEQHFPELPSSMVNILPIASKVGNVVSKWFSDGIGRNLGFGESYAHERARILGNMSVEQYHEYKQQQAQEDKKWYNSFENIPLLNIISSRNDILDVAARAPAINLAAGMSSQQRKKHPIVTHALQSISEFTSPESAKTQLEFTVGGTLLEPFVGAALGWTGTQAAKVGLTKTGQFLASPKALAWAMHGTNLGPAIKDLAINSYHALALTDQGKTEDAEGAWGDILGNMVVLAGMHYGIKGLEAGSEMENTKRLNDSASKLYDKKFTALDPQEKAAVLYDAVGSADPHFNDRVNHEVAKLRRQTGGSVAASGEVAQKLLDRHLRTEASKTVLNQIITRELQESAYRQEMARRESEARRAQMEKEDAEKRSADIRQEQEARQAEAHPEPVEKRGARQIVQRGSIYTTEREEGRYEPEPTPAPIQITDRRAAAVVIPRTPQVVAAESRVQELSEQRMGTSFSSLPIARQMVAARWMERFHPEAWRDFQGTPAYQTFQGHVERQRQIDAVYKHYLERHPHGEDHVLAPNADVHAGLAQLILNRTDVNTSLAADPKTHRALNESTEASMGKSWDSLEPADRGAALAEFLREDPEHLRAFLTPDITARIRSGQHIDLANMEAELVDRQQVHILMGERDRIQRDMDRSVADQFVTEQRQRHQGEITDTMYQALTGRDPSLEAVHEAGRNITALASDLGLGTISDFGDVFRIEKAVRETPDGLRTPKMREFLTRMAQIRAAAEDHIVRSISEATADSFRTMAPEDARDKAARSMMEYASDAADLQQAADRQRQEGNTAQADATAETAAELRKKADAVQAGAESAQNPAPEKPTVPRPDILLGRETKIVTPSNPQGYQAHYAAVAVDATRSSHLPISYQPREGYNQNGQPRDYSINREAQGNIESKAGQIDADQLLSDSVQALDGPSIVEPERMDIISGNGRDLIEETARIRHPKEYARYMEEKFKRAAKFGLDPEQIRAKFGDRFKIVRVLDKPVVDEHEWARLGIEFNRDPMQGLSQAESGVALSRLLTPGFVGRLTAIIDTLPSVGKDGRPLTIREAMRARSSDLAQLLVDAGVISPNKMAEFVVDGELNENSKSLFENMLGALTVTDPATMEQASASTKDKLARAGLFFVKMRDAGENWDLASMNTDAVRLLTRAQDAAARLSTLIPRKGAEEIAGKSLVDRYLHPENYTDTKGFGPAGTFEFDGQPLHPPVHAGVESLAKAIEESPRDYALMMARYADASNGVQGSMFGAEHPADVFTREIASKYGMKVVPEEWGMVTGLSPVEKAAIEDSRGPLPVEPEEHHSTVTADVTPDSTAVQDAVPEGPRNVRDLRKALETHPGLTNEQADALGTIFEEVIPNAVGEDANTILGNRRLTLALGGTENTPEGKEARGYHQILEDGRAIIRLCDSADTSTFLHEMAHYIRRYLSPGDQAIANSFVEAKPGEEWTDAQEEKFAQAFERYHYDGGIRRGKLEKVFSTLNRAMQSIYNAVTMRGYAKGTPELNAMFDRWYDWSRAERKPITKRLDVDALVSAANGTVVIPDDAKIIRSSGRKPSENATNKVFLSEEQATEFIKNKKNGVRAWEMYRVKGDDNVYVRADAKKGKKLFQGQNADVFTLAKRARDLEAELKRTTDPREQARLRGVLNGIEDKLRTSSLIVGAAPVTRDTSVIQLVHGVSEMPTALEPTTVAGAEKVQGIFGDPTAIETGRRRGPERAGTAGKPGNEPGKAGEVAQPAGASDREHAKREAAPIAKPERDPLAGVRAAKLKAPDVPRGTPVVDPDRWRQHVEDLGLPKGTPPPTIRLEPDIRNMLIFPGQPEAVENVLSALQQYDGTVLASGAGTGKTHMLSAIAQHLLGEGGDKVGLLVTKSQNLIHEADGFVDTARKYGVDVNPLPSDINEVQTGMYAATYSGIRGDKSVLSIPWDFVLFDESGEARNWTKSGQGKAVALLGHAANKVVYSSATPYHCLAPDTPVLMHDGSVKKVQDVIVGDNVMGPDSNPRKVCGLSHGFGQMYNVIPKKGDSYKVNENHILSLRVAGRVPSFQNAYGKRYPGWRSYPPDSIVNLSVLDYLQASKSFRGRLLGYRTGVNFPEHKVPIDPYWLGLWLGDGDALTAEICVSRFDPEIEEYIRSYARRLGLAATESAGTSPAVKILRISRGIRGSQKGKFGGVPANPLVSTLRDLGVIGKNSINKHIPASYKANSREVRLRLLAGLIDSDGTCTKKGFAITTKSRRLADDILFLCRSLGFAAYAKPVFYALSKEKDKPNWHIGISGDLDIVPTLLPRKKCQKRKTLVLRADNPSPTSRNAKDVLKVGIRVEPCGIGEFYGFEVDGDKLFVLGDFTVTHNSVMEMGYMHKLGLWPHGGFFEWAQQFGLREVGPNSYSGGASARRLEKLRQQLIERGQWQQLYKDLSGTEAHVVLVPNSAEVKTGIRNIRAAFAMAKAAFIKEGMSKYITPTAGHESIYLKRYIAGARLNEAIGLAKRAIDAGWRPVMFTEYRSPAETGMDLFHNLPGNLGTKINAMLPPLPDVVAAMRDAFGDKVGIFAGAATELRADQLEGFQSGEKHALYMTYGAGGVGANAQDKFGDQPRMGIYIDMPWGGPMLEQGTNRTYRYGSQSGAANIFLTSDALPEMKLLATKVLPRMRSLKAAVFGEKIESSLSRNLREAAGIPEELLQYEHGEELTPEAAEFEKTGEGAKYTHLDDFEIPDADKFKHKPMKYKGEGKKLYQGPKEPFEDEADAAWNEMLGRLSKLPAKPAQAIASKEPIIKQHAAEAGRRSMGTGEPVASAVERATRDVENDALIWYDDLKQHTRDAAQFLKSMDWMFGTSGDRAVWKILRDQGLNDTGLELKRRMIDYDLRSGNYRGEFGGMIEKIIRGNKLSAPDLEMVSKVVEGQAQSEDPRILKAVGEFRHFTATVRKRLADAGMAVVFYDEKGKRAEFPYSKIADDPNYWPRIYDWNKKFVLDDGKGGKTVTSLSEIMNMPTSSERREETIERFAKARGISKIKAQLFFDKNARGIRLAGNIERAREYELPLYGRDRRALDRYVNEVAEKLAAAEIHGQFREKTDHLIDQIDDRKMRNLVNQIITTDLNPSRLHDADRIALRWANRWLVMSKMSLSALKLPFHLAKTSMATNTRSVVLSMLKGVTSLQELRNNAADCGAMTDYIRQAWMREYGLNTRGWDQTMLDFNGFTALMKASRVVAAGAGRLFFEKYAYPELRRNPDNPVLRRKLKDLYGMSDEQLTEIAKNGYGPADVRRMELGAANWTTGSGRPSELPVAWRGVGASEDWLAQRFVTIIRIMQSLHGFMFKTANLVNRSVFDELKQGDYKTGGPYHLIGRFAVNFGLAGALLGGILHIRHQLSGSPEKEIEDRRMAYIASHPASKEAFFWAMSDLSMGMGIDALTQLFDQIATHNPKDREKIVSQGRPMSAMKDLLLGVAAQDAWEAATGFYNYASTFQDTGHHRQSPEERRRNIEVRLANEEIPITRQVMKPQTVKPKGWPRRRRTASALR